MIARALIILASVFVVACHERAAPATSTPAGAPEPKVFPLPGASGNATLDLLAYDRAHDQVWIPV